MRNPFKKRKAPFVSIRATGFEVWPQEATNVGSVMFSPDGGRVTGQIRTYVAGARTERQSLGQPLDDRIRQIVNETLDAAAKDGRRWQ